MSKPTSPYNKPDMITLVLNDDGLIPNNVLPLIVYQGALTLASLQDTSTVRRFFADNNWQGSWVNGIFDFHHYHSTAHEILAIYKGQAKVQMGGEQGEIMTVKRGDVIVIPAGVGHKNLGASADFVVIGAYPQGQRPDRCYGNKEERPQADRNIERVVLPDSDPVYGSSGPLRQLWKT